MKKNYCSFKPVILPYTVGRPINWVEQFNCSAPIDVEIGFGMGEFLMRIARESPDRNFIGIEQHWERICKTLRAITKEQLLKNGALRNIRILKIDARVVFERIFVSESIDKIYCLFPCPWPKKSHVKHRLFSNSFLKLLNSRLKKDGALKIVTDFYPYRDWILEQIQRTGFDVETRTVSSKYDTKFERKWRGEGQEVFFELNFLKNRHIHVPVQRDFVMKGYALNNFNASHLQLNDVKGDISVIFKDVIFDKEKQKMMIRALVAEEHLEQHFWIAITKKKNNWRVARAEGQNFLPTEGVAKALDVVYEAAKKNCSGVVVNG